MKRFLEGTITVLLFCMLSTLHAGKDERALEIPYSEATNDCIECHSVATPGIYWDWLRSRHALTTPDASLKKTELERRVSSGDIPDRFLAVGIGCYECHGLNAADHGDRFDHFGYEISIVVSPKDCRTCHADEVEQYSHSKKAYALKILTENPVYQLLIDAITGKKDIDGVTSATKKVENHIARGTCYACHGTEITVNGTRTVETAFGEVVVPALDAWPNQGVGRINPDGSRGACTSCHPRHGFSIEIARKPYTCAQCHVEPDVPAYNVYKESKHGNIFESKKSNWKWDEIPWKAGVDFQSPTCSSCHNSLIVTPDGEVVATRTHDFGGRLWLRIFGVIYSHPQPASGKTFEVRNKDDLPLPTAFTGEHAVGFLIDANEQRERKATMGNVCNACHSTSWASGHFAALEEASRDADQMVLSSTRLMVNGWNEGLEDRANPFDETIEQLWVKQWLFHANCVRYAYAMGGPDYATFKNGWWDLTHTHEQMRTFIDLKRREK